MRFADLSLKIKTVCVLVPVMLITFVVHSVIIYRATYEEVLEDLEREAHSIRSVLMATRRVYHHQFIDSGLPVNKTTIGFLPAHAMGRISKDFNNWTDSGLTFNNVSDRARNPDNAADELELDAMRFFRENPEEKDRLVFIEGANPIYHFTEPIWIESYCLSCHGKREDAPPTIADNYPGSYDYELGDLRGVMSIKMPVGFAQTRATQAAVASMSINFFGYVVIFIVLYVLFNRFTLQPLGALVLGSRQLAKGNYRWRSDIEGPQEIKEVAEAFDRMAVEIEARDKDIRTSEAQYRGVTETAGDAIVTSDEEGRITTWNRSAERIFGYTREEALGTSIEVLIPERYKAMHGDRFTYSASQSESTFSNGRTIEGYGLRKDGTEFPVEVSLSMWKKEDGRQFTAILRDITQSKKLEEQLLQSQKMEAVGKLAGGVAHDFNNLLQVISGYSEMALESSKAGEPVEKDIEGVIQASEKAVELVSQLLSYSRRQVLELKAVDLSKVVETMGGMIGRLIGEHITIEIHSEPKLKLVEADQGLLEQALMNLCINARDAMPDGGTLSITTENVSLDAEFATLHSWSIPGDYVVLSVIDSGCGMKEAVQKEIFEPFFTTKEVGKGTGLGLSTVYGIVAQHGGGLLVESEAGEGTSFRIYLPTVTSVLVDSDVQKEIQTEGGSETILLADDDNGVRELTRRNLENAGYHVLQAADGEEAVRISEEYADDIDLLIFDVVMPNLSGKDAYEHICRTRPNVPVIFATGYDSGSLHTDFVLDADFKLIQKPFRRESLLQMIREVLSSRRVS